MSQPRLRERPHLPFSPSLVPLVHRALASHSHDFLWSSWGGYMGGPGGQGCSEIPFLGTPWSFWALQVAKDEGSACLLLRQGFGHSFPHLVYQQQLLGMSGEDLMKSSGVFLPWGLWFLSMASRMMLRNEVARPAWLSCLKLASLVLKLCLSTTSLFCWTLWQLCGAPLYPHANLCPLRTKTSL